MKLTLPFPPSVNHYRRTYCSVDSAHPIVTRLSSVTKEYRNTAGWQAKEQGVRMLEGAVQVEIHAYRALNGVGGRRSFDSDNLQKVLFDTLEGIAWDNDNQIRHFSVTMHDIPRGEKDRMELTILPYKEEGEEDGQP